MILKKIVRYLFWATVAVIGLALIVLAYKDFLIIPIETKDTESYSNSCLRITLLPTGFLVHTRWLDITQLDQSYGDDRLLCTRKDRTNQEITHVIKDLNQASGRITNLPKFMDDPEGTFLIEENLELKYTLDQMTNFNQSQSSRIDFLLKEIESLRREGVIN